MAKSSEIPVGLYEKALPAELSWEERLEMASSAGYDFVEISIDESDERLSRLTWTSSEHAELRTAINNTGIPILTMGVSGHRKFPLGSASREIRDRGVDILYRAIDFASDIGVKIIQICCYDVFYETSNHDSHRRYLEGLRLGAKRAGTAGVMLGVENVDVEFSESVEKLMQIVHKVDSPWVNIYPDMGNLVAAGFDPVSQLRLGEGYMVAVHVKDATPGVYRGVVFESGDVQFGDVFQTLSDIGFWGPMVVEMWDQLQIDGDGLDLAVHARSMVSQLISNTWSEKPENGK